MSVLPDLQAGPRNVMVYAGMQGVPPACPDVPFVSSMEAWLRSARVEMVRRSVDLPIAKLNDLGMPFRVYVCDHQKRQREILNIGALIWKRGRL
jgi:hypothetical protein